MVEITNVINEIKAKLDYKYSILRPVTAKEMREQGEASYVSSFTTKAMASRFKYHSDYWDDESTYRENWETLMQYMQPYMRKHVLYDGRPCKIVAVLIDEYYNDVGHSRLLVEWGA